MKIMQANKRQVAEAFSASALAACALCVLACAIGSASAAASGANFKLSPTAPFQRISSTRPNQFASVRPARDEISAVIPSPNENVDDSSSSSSPNHFAGESDDEVSSSYANAQIGDIIRRTSQQQQQQQQSPSSPSVHASGSKTVPVYVSPFVRPQASSSSSSSAASVASSALIAMPVASAIPRASTTLISRVGESHSSPSSSYGNESPMSESKMTKYASAPSDLKTSASYGKFDYSSLSLFASTSGRRRQTGSTTCLAGA